MINKSTLKEDLNVTSTFGVAEREKTNPKKNNLAENSKKLTYVKINLLYSTSRLKKYRNHEYILTYILR